MTAQNPDFATLLQFLKETYEEKIPFNRIFKLQIASLEENNVCINFGMRKELLGNYKYEILHGGVIASVLDTTGGLVASLSVLKKMIGQPLEEIEKRLFKIGTIDLRIDFLRPGHGNYFLSTGSIIRIGNQIVVVRTALHNDEKILVAAGIGTYMLG